jgi:arylsulfatase A-like enzyme
VSLFTGLHPDEHGIAKNGQTLPGDVTPVAEGFARAGYETAAFVSSFVLERRFGLHRGFAVYDDDFEGADSSLGRSRTSFQGHEVPGIFDRRANATTDRAIEWLAARDDSRPFLLWVHYFDPHVPYDPPEPHRGRFTRAGQRGEKERVTDLYDAEIHFTDAQLARLLAAVRSAAPPDQTITLVTSDHGEGLWDHGWLRHGVNVYEEAVRVPLIVHWPGHIPPGLRITGLVSSADVAPTLAGLTGLPLGADGSRSSDQSAVLLGGAAPDADRPVFFQRRAYASRTVEHLRVAGPKRAVRWRDWKLIDSPDEIGFELYDLARDPGERDNLAGRAPETLQELRAHLDDWSRDSNARGPDPQAAMGDEVRERLAALGYVE